ncbi:MAG: His/Gly/Thr/Pro-type tRNA ligase C-terminal domain-containing protein, partial [Planctomycetota bacterium]
AGLRVSGDYRPEKIGAKIRDAQLELIPYMFILGGRELENNTVSVRDRLEGDLGPMSCEQAIERLQQEIEARTVRQTFAGDAGLGERSAQNGY